MSGYDHDACTRCGGELPGFDAIFHREAAYCGEACSVPVFAVGDGASYSFINDVYPATIRKISKSGHMIWISSDRVVKGFFSPVDVNPTQWRCFTRRADGHYREKGQRSPVLSEGRTYIHPREI